MWQKIYPFLISCYPHWQFSEGQHWAERSSKEDFVEGKYTEPLKITRKETTKVHSSSSDWTTKIGTIRCICHNLSAG